jgi:hypothetical protein
VNEARPPDPQATIKLLQWLAARLRADIPEGIGFTLLLFDFGDQGQLHYISSADRLSMKVTLRALLNKWERNEYDGGILRSDDESKALREAADP